MADGTCVATERTLVEIRVDAIDPDLHQPRDLPRDDEPALRERVADILATIEAEGGEPVNNRGIREPLKVRRAGDRFPLVDGERRWHAARFAGLRRVLCEILVLAPEEVLAEQLRTHGVDLSPLEEARALARLASEHKLDVAEIAARTGRTPRLVQKRLALLALAPEGRAALTRSASESGLRITLGLAEELTTLADDAQVAALRSLAGRWRTGDDPVGKKEGKYEIHRQRRTLKTAGFDLADKSLPGGSCLVCPKRSGAQGALYLDGVEDRDLCGDASCFESRQKAHCTRALEKAAAAKVPVATAGDVKKLFSFGRLSHDAPMIDLSAPCDLVSAPEVNPQNEGRRGGPERCPEDKAGAHDWSEITVREDDEDEDDRPAAEAGCEAWVECQCGAWQEKPAPAWHHPVPRGWKPPTWGEALKLGESAATPAPTMVAPVEGRVVELFDRKAALETLQRAGVIDAQTAKNELRAAAPPKKSTGTLEKWQVDNKAAELATAEARATIALRAEKKKPDDVRVWRLLAGLILSRNQGADLLDPAAARRRESSVKKGAKSIEELRAWVGVQKEHGPVRGLVFELLTADTYGDDCQLAIACRAFDVDLPALKSAAAAKVRADAKAKAKGKAKPEATIATKAAAGTKPAKASKKRTEQLDEGEGEGEGDRDVKPAKASKPAGPTAVDQLIASGEVKGSVSGTEVRASLTEHDVEQLAQRLKIERVFQRLDPKQVPCSVKGCSAAAGADCSGLDEGLFHKARVTTARAQAALPGLAGESGACTHCGCTASKPCVGDVGAPRPPGDVCHACARLADAIVAECAKPKAEKAIKALKPFSSADGQRRTTSVLRALLTAGRLYRQGDKLVAK